MSMGAAIFTDRENNRPAPKAPAVATVAVTPRTVHSAVLSDSDHRQREKRT